MQSDNEVLAVVRDVLTLPDIASVRAGTKAMIAEALAALGKRDTARACVGVSERFYGERTEWTFSFDASNFQPGIGRTYIIPAHDNLARHPPVG